MMGIWLMTIFVLGSACTSVSSAGIVSCIYRASQSDSDYSIEDIPADLCTKVIFAYATLQDDNTIGMSDTEKDPDRYKRLNALKSKNPDLKTIIAIGGSSDDGAKYSKMAADATKTQTFVDSIVPFLQSNGFSGLDLNWQFPGDVNRGGQAADKENLVKLLKSLYQSLNKIYELSVSVSVLKSVLDIGYDIPSICADGVVDYVNCMAYDIHGNWENQTNVHTPLHHFPGDPSPVMEQTVHDGLKLWIAGGCKESKLVMGLAFYGNAFTLTDKSKNGLGAPIEKGQPVPPSMSYLQICQTFSDASYTEVMVPEAEVPYRYKDTLWVGYENADSMQIKITFVQNQSYAGVMVWSIDRDDNTNICGGGKNTLLNIVAQIKGKSKKCRCLG